MPKVETCWGIDIGNASLKALRLRPGESPQLVVAEAFDYIEYPMLLTQPSADPASLVETALRQFLSRNEVRGHKIAISVSGATGLARFIKLPPVELSKLPDVVRYEAKQQIPYDLNNVVWRYQRLDAGGGESGFTLGTTIGLFALKREQVEAALQPFRNLGIEVDIIQLSPLAIFNYVRFDAMPDLPPPDEYDPDNPPPAVAVISMGTDSTDLVITNGYRVWQRNIPIGGSHFTKALSKELKLTFSKAEHIKKNPTTYSDPKAVFQAMRPVFAELLSEIQRSISYYNSIERSIEITRGLALGNPMKLQGLRAYLEKGLGFPLESVEHFEHLMGPDVVQSPVFRENLSCFAIVYGLALQGIGRAYMEINMLPDEIVKDRFIRAKKPWALAAATTLLFGCAVSFAAQSMALSTVSPERFGDAERAATQVLNTVKQYQSELASVEAEFDKIKTIGSNITGSVEGRLLWLELLTAINQALPQFERKAAETLDVSSAGDAKKQQEILERRDEIHITSLEAVRMEQLETWWQQMGGWYRPPGEKEPEPQATTAPTTGSAMGSAAGSATSPYGASYGMSSGPESLYGGLSGAVLGDPPAPNQPPAGVTGPSGPGYVIRLTGYHFHNSDVAGTNQGAQYVRNTLIKKLEEGQFLINGKWVTAKELGIMYPMLINPGRIRVVRIRDPLYTPPTTPTGTPGLPLGTAPTLTGIPGSPLQPGATGVGATPTTTGDAIPGFITLRRFDFTIQFAWQPKTESEREEARKKAAEEAAQQAGGTGEAQTIPSGTAQPAAGGAPTGPATPVPPGTGAPSTPTPGTPQPGVSPPQGIAPAVAPGPGVPPTVAPPQPAPGNLPGVPPAGGASGAGVAPNPGTTVGP
uniref:type IV pilus assembly protein PilM n=1 Tax=Thermogutta sp. TaxID=1962930 RepID=UPI0032205474